MFARSPIIREIEVKSVFSKSNLPVCEYSVNPYVGCTHGCKYCYATSGLEGARRRMQQHNPLSPLLIGQLKGDETITDREVKSDKDNQISLFDLPEMYMKF